MPNQSGNAYALTTLCPLRLQHGLGEGPATLLRKQLNDTSTDEQSPMAQVPNTYLCRFFVLDDVVYEGKPATEDHLRSKYLVFTSNFHGELEPYLHGMWAHAEAFIRETWRYCIGFDEVRDATAFARYIQRCQVETTFFFMGSSDAPLAEQLKALYLQQEFSSFALEHQGWPAAKLQAAFNEFVARVEPRNLARPTWRAGASRREVAVVGEAGALP
jgi:hypothetical protein